MKRLLVCNSLPLAILENIIRSPKNAEPLKAIHNMPLNPLNGVWDSLNNFLFNFGSIFDISPSKYKIILYGNFKIFYRRYSSAAEQLSRKQ